MQVFVASEFETHIFPGERPMSKGYSGSTLNPRIPEVVKTFESVNANGHGVLYSKGSFLPPNVVADHFQGVVSYDDYIIQSYSNIDYSRGYIVVINKKKKAVTLVFHTPIDGYPHPGGMQVIGDYLAVALENKKTDQSYIIFYYLKSMTDDIEPSFLPFWIRRPKGDDGGKGGAGGVGITDWFDAKTKSNRYLIAAYDDGKCDFYVAENDYLVTNDTPAKFQFREKLSQNSYSTVSLITDDNNVKWLLGFYSTGALPEEDWVDLYTVSVSKKQVAFIQKKHFYFDNPGAFRWGGGVVLHKATSNFDFLGTQRNPGIEDHKINFFTSP